MEERNLNFWRGGGWGGAVGWVGDLVVYPWLLGSE